jgi:hypothetical protein
MRAAQLRPGVNAEGRVGQVGAHGQQHRGRKQRAGGGAQGDLGGERATLAALQATTAPAHPAHGHQRVDIGDLRKARIDRQGTREGDQAPTAAAPVAGRGERPLDSQEQHRQQRQRVDPRVGEPGELAVEGKGDGPRDRRRAREIEAAQQPVGADPGHEFEQDVLIQLPV